MNALPSKPSQPFWKLILKQFDDLLVKILIAAAVISFILGLANGEGSYAFVEPGVIIIILIVITISMQREPIREVFKKLKIFSKCSLLPSGLFIQWIIGPAENETERIVQFVGITASVVSITKVDFNQNRKTFK